MSWKVPESGQSARSQRATRRANGLLPARLDVLLSMACPTDVFVDIGCDHGLLALAAVPAIAPASIGIDIHEPPLRRARANRARGACPAATDFFQGDTLADVCVHRPCVVALAGVGGLLIADRIELIRQHAPKMQRLLVNPMVDERPMRRALYAASMKPVDQRLVEDGKRLFLLESWEPTPTPVTPSEEDIILGQVPRLRGGELWPLWLQTQLAWLKRRVAGPGATPELQHHLELVSAAMASPEG